jgi:adenylate cyclase
LTSILAADAAGYSRLMSENEEATLRTLTEHRLTIDALIGRHHGRIFGTAGDSVLAEFSSVVEAVQCAIDIQHELRSKNDALPPARRMLFRIGVNLGDVMVRDGDLFGDGVNLAARLQDVADPGGICISSAVYEQVRNKLTVAFDFLGRRSVKNFADVVPVYRLRLGGETGAPAAAARPTGVPRPSQDKRRAVRKLVRQAMSFGVIIVFLFVLNMVTNSRNWWWYWPALGLSLALALSAIRIFMAEGEDHIARSHDRSDPADEASPPPPPARPPPRA